MTSIRNLSREQRRVALSMIAGLAFTLIVFIGCLAIDRTPVPAPLAVRLQSTIAADLFVVLWLAAAIANVARLRFFSARDIAGSSGENESDAVRNASAILQNTFEQTCLAVFAHLAIAALISGSTFLIPALVALFSTGRLLFWVGYQHGAAGRAFGFALTFYPTVLTLLFSAGAVIAGVTS